MSVKTIRKFLLVAASLPLAARGCTQSTTSKDVADAQKKVQKEENDAAQARHEAMKPTLDDNADPKVQKEEADAAAAQANLNEKAQEHAATQARDAFLAQAQSTLDATDRQIDGLKDRVKNEEGAAKDATQKQIDDLKSRRDRLSDAISKVKKADLMKWTDHKVEVETALKELNAQGAALR